MAPIPACSPVLVQVYAELADLERATLQRHLRYAWLALVVLTWLAPVDAAQPSTQTSVRSVQIAVRGSLTVATIEADGPLPLPTSGEVDSPPRIYLDLAGVTPQATGMTRSSGGGSVRRVRTALHAIGPNVSRVVLDLTQPETFRINADERESGRIVILIGAESSPAPPTPARRNLPHETAIPDLRLPPSEVEQYRRQLQGALERIESRRPVIEAIDASVAVPIDMLESTAVELSDLRRILGAIKPSEALRTTHDLLAVSCTLAATATTLQIQASRNNDPEARRNAPSTAAGALMLLDRACARLGCSSTKP